jgi:hypothetical protein
MYALLYSTFLDGALLGQFHFALLNWQIDLGQVLDVCNTYDWFTQFYVN